MIRVSFLCGFLDPPTSHQKTYRCVRSAHCRTNATVSLESPVRIYVRTNICPSVAHSFVLLNERFWNASTCWFVRTNVYLLHFCPTLGVLYTPTILKKRVIRLLKVLKRRKYFFQIVVRLRICFSVSFAKTIIIKYVFRSGIIFIVRSASSIIMRHGKIKPIILRCWRIPRERRSRRATA